MIETNIIVWEPINSYEDNINKDDNIHKSNMFYTDARTVIGIIMQSLKSIGQF